MEKIIYHAHAVYYNTSGNKRMFDGIFSTSGPIESAADYEQLKKSILEHFNLNPPLERLQIVSLSRL